MKPNDLSPKVPWFIRVLYPDVVIPVVGAVIIAWMIWASFCK